jgi:very-short-patch-repair endonuclease
MMLFYGLLIVLVAVAVSTFVVMPAGPRQAAYRRRPTKTSNEIEFYGRIVGALPELHVCRQIAIHAIIGPTSRSSKTRLIDFRRVSQKVIDYAVFDSKWAIVVLIELEERTHVASRDAIRDSYTAAAGIRTLRDPSRARPLEVQITADVRAIQLAAPAASAALIHAPTPVAPSVTLRDVR